MVVVLQEAAMMIEKETFEKFDPKAVLVFEEVPVKNAESALKAT
jgi:HD-GYP domain-containing protein (c-di-GMP phosphodiesterase class II)